MNPTIPQCSLPILTATQDRDNTNVPLNRIAVIGPLPASPEGGGAAISDDGVAVPAPLGRVREGHNLRHRTLLLASTLFVAAGLWSILFLFMADSAAATEVVGATACGSVTSVPTDECEALSSLYAQTAGANWTQQAEWLTFGPDAPCDWYGVRCANGHVTELLLASNGLRGTIPYTIGYLSKLTTLHLANNALSGVVPLRICALAATVTDGHLGYNALSTQSTRTKDCLDRIDTDWRATQTTAPRNLAVTEFYTSALRLTWEPMPYQADSGGYEIYYSESLTGSFQLHGVVPSKAASSYLADGLTPGVRYYFGVRSYTDPHGDQANKVVSQPVKSGGVTKAITGNVVVAAYFPADNDLASQIRYVIRRFRRGTMVNPNVTVLLLVDGNQADDTRLLHLQDGVVAETTAVVDQWGTSELDTADPLVLSWFLQYVRQNYPATKTIVSLMGHGLALAPEVDWPETTVPEAEIASAAQFERSGSFPPLPRGWDDTPNDVTNNSYMSTTDVGEALMAATDNGANPFDIVYFDQCFQGNLDALYEVYSAAEVFVASPNYAWLVAAYDKYISGFSPNLSAEEMADHIVQPYQGTLNKHHPNTIFWVRGDAIPLIAEAVSKVGDALTLALNDGRAGAIATAVRNSQYVDTTQCGKRTLQLGPPDELIGIETFAANLRNQFPATEPFGLMDALQELRVAMNGINKLSRSGQPYIAPDEFWDYTDSLTILTPLPRNSRSGVAWRASIYQVTAPFTATSALVPGTPVTVTKSLAFTKEGRWDDFLAQWFDDLSPTVGQWCHYMPPELVDVANGETMTLTAELQRDAGVTLQWSAADAESVEEYELYLNSPDRVSWILSQSVNVSATATAISPLAAGEYGMQVWARNNEDELVAQSNTVTVTVPITQPPVNGLIFIPFVAK